LYPLTPEGFGALCANRFLQEQLPRVGIAHPQPPAADRKTEMQVE